MLVVCAGFSVMVKHWS